MDVAQHLHNPDQRDLAMKVAHVVNPIEDVGRVPGTTVLMNSFLMALASCLGATPFFFVSDLSPNLIGIANSIACGVMLACSFDLIHEGESYNTLYLMLGILIGTLSIQWTQQHLEKYENLRFESLQGASARKILLVLTIMAAHAAGEGAGVGVSYAGKDGWSQGFLVTLAIGLHNIPEGLAIATVLISRGVRPKRAVVWNFFAAIPQAIFALPAYLFVDAFKACLPFAVGLAAGCMIWVVFSEIIPDALENIPAQKAATIITMSVIWLESLKQFMSFLEKNESFSILKNSKSPFLASLSIVCPLIVAIMIKAKIRYLSFSVGIGVGMQFICGLTIALIQLFTSNNSMTSTLVWVFIGSISSIFISKYLNKPNQQVAGKDNEDHNGNLPIISNMNYKGHLHEGRFFLDLFLALEYCSLIGIGIYGGSFVQNAFQSSKDLWHLFFPLFFLAVLYGTMVGLWMLRIPLRKNLQLWILIQLLLCTPWLMAVMFPGFYTQGQLWKVLALMSGFVVSSSVQLMCTKCGILAKIKATHREGSTLESVPEIEALSSSVENPAMVGSDLWTNNPHFYQSLGVLFGILISSGGFTILAAFCKWTTFCSR